MSVIHRLSSTFPIWLAFSFLIAVLGLLLTIWNTYGSRKLRYIGMTMAIQVFVVVFAGLVVNAVFESKLRQDLVSRLNSVNITIALCGLQIDTEEQGKIIEELKRIKRMSQRHFIATDSISISFFDGIDHSVIVIGRDSTVPYNHLVYWRTKEYGMNEIGCLKTQYFKDITCK